MPTGATRRPGTSSTFDDGSGMRYRAGALAIGDELDDGGRCLRRRRSRRLPRSRDRRGRPPARLLTEPLEPRRCNHSVRKPLVLVVAAVCAWPTQALAKGPDYASISGPGIHGSIRIDGDGESGTDTPLGALVTYGGYPTQVFGHHPKDPTTPVRPAGNLGPRYRVAYSRSRPRTGGSRFSPNPYAVPRAVTYMKPGQPIFELVRTHGGWHVARPGLRRTLLAAGLPETPPTAASSHAWRIALPASALAALAGAGALLVLRRRHQSRPATAA